jgi:SP family arabinose:H+ symporter-like MFS transporter
MAEIKLTKKSSLKPSDKASTLQAVNLRYVIIICGIASLGGLLFGFDTAVISGALSSLSIQFNLNEQPVLQGWTVSSVLLGSILGAAMAGFIADRFGRRPSMKLTALLYLLSAIGSALAPDLTFFIIARLAGGFGVGIAAMVVPLYISEVSPPTIRGSMVSLYQLSVALGILVAYFSNQWIGGIPTYNLGGGLDFLLAENWRAMLGTEIIPAAAFFLCLYIVPASPRYLMMLGQEEKARHILTKLSNRATADQEITEIREALKEESGSFRELFGSGLRIPVFIAVFLAVISQFSGIDIILHYGPVILEKAGFSFSDSLNGQIIFGVILLIFTLLALWKVDSLGRRKLLLYGNAGVVISLLTISYLFQADGSSQSSLIIAISCFIASFAFSLGPLPWIIMSEIFPTKVRGRAMSLGTLVLFGANWLLAQIFPWMSVSLGESLTFFILAMFMLSTFWFVRKVLPETKGRSLEEIERSWKGKD